MNHPDWILPIFILFCIRYPIINLGNIPNRLYKFWLWRKQSSGNCSFGCTSTHSSLVIPHSLFYCIWNLAFNSSSKLLLLASIPTSFDGLNFDLFYSWFSYRLFTTLVLFTYWVASFVTGKIWSVCRSGRFFFPSLFPSCSKLEFALYLNISVSLQCRFVRRCFLFHTGLDDRLSSWQHCFSDHQCTFSSP